MPNVEFSGTVEESPMRRMAPAVWGNAGDPTIYGFLDFDATRLNARIKELRAAGTRVTVTTMVARALALTLGKHPDLNVVLRRRRLYRRADVDIFLQVAIPSGEGEGLGKTDLSGVKILQADTKDAATMHAEIKARVEQVRKNQDPELAKSKKNIQRIPRLLLKPILHLLNYFQVQWNFRMKWAGMPKDPFGSAMVTSLGMLGVETGFAPLFPLGGPAILMLVGSTKKRAVVDVDGNVVARDMLRLCGTFDHRVVDGFHLATMGKELRRLIENEPELL